VPRQTVMLFADRASGGLLSRANRQLNSAKSTKLDAAAGSNGMTHAARRKLSFRPKTLAHLGGVAPPSSRQAECLSASRVIARSSVALPRARDLRRQPQATKSRRFEDAPRAARARCS
jgi:hypothetical protein